MTLNITTIGVLVKDPIGDERYTMWKVKSFGREITLFSTDAAAQSRLEYRNGMRIRGEGRGSWNNFNEVWGLQLSNSAIDGSDSEDELKIKVDGSIGHELDIEHDDEDEGGGRYIHVEIEAPVRVKDSAGNWGDGLAYVRGFVLEEAVDKLLKLDEEGVTSMCFSGDLHAEPCWIKGTEPGYYVEISDVTPSQGRGSTDDDDFWKSKPMRLANRKSGPVVKAGTLGRKLPPKKGGTTISDGGPNDEMPF
jgi:hypothetical protein